MFKRSICTLSAEAIENAKAFVNGKLQEKPELLEAREDAVSSKLDNLFVEPMEFLQS